MKFISWKLFDQALLYVFLFIFVAVVGTTAHAVNNYYVSPSGSGSACSLARPCGSINQAEATLVVGASGTCTAGSGWISIPNVGACIHVAPGTYSGNITTSKSGTASAQIVFISDTRALPPSPGGAKILNGYWTMNGNYSQIDGFEFTWPSGNAAVLMQSGNHRSVQYNYIHDVNLSGCTPNGVIHDTTAPTDHETINGNIIRHFGSQSGSCSGYRSFHGIYSDGAANVITNNIISGGTAGFGITKQYASVTDCTPGVISNNTIFNNAAGIVINHENSPCGFNNWTVSNNIIVNNGIAGTGGRGDSFGFYFYRSVGNSLVSNNLLYGNLPSNVGLANGATNTSVNQKSDSSTSATFTNFQSDTNAAPASNYSHDNYRIKAGSNSIQNGTTSCAASPGLNPCVAALDIVGLGRSGLVPDIGVYQKESATAGVPAAPTGLAALVQ